MNMMESYRRAQDGLEAMLAAVPAEKWDAPSPCPEWTLRDVAGHMIWGQEQMRHWATGQEYGVPTGAPGAPHPGEMAGGDPLEIWRAARADSVKTLTDEAIGRTVTLEGLGEVPLAAMITVWVNDQLIHTWDIGHGLGIDVRLDPGLVPASWEWARENVLRRPGFFGPELTPPADADEQTRLLAFLGRAPWQPVASA
ncbi:MAG TPA: TIGR03086 family metal-binding protein [Streptosporangiaceae bacterium]|jgi:uncharacterized protein (TIGR03086 family)